MDDATKARLRALAETGKGFALAAAVHLDGKRIKGGSSRSPHFRATGGLGAAARPTMPPPAPADGPGTELRALIASLGLTERPGCRCKAIAAEMNRAGAAGCRQHRSAFVARLKANADRWYGWGDWVRAGANALASGLAFRLDWSDPLGGLFDEAVCRAEEKQQP